MKLFEGFRDIDKRGLFSYLTQLGFERRKRSSGDAAVGYHDNMFFKTIGESILIGGISDIDFANSLRNEFLKESVVSKLRFVYKRGNKILVNPKENTLSPEELTSRRIDFVIYQGSDIPRGGQKWVDRN